MKQIPLTQGQFALVDDDDFEKVNQFKWHACKRIHQHWVTYYAGRSLRINGKKICILMHRFIVSADGNTEVDHINGDGLNNTKSNIRLATNSQNQMNRRKTPDCSSKYKGVYYDIHRNKWAAELKFKDKRVRLGRFENEIDAAKMYDIKAKELYGDFANTNF